MQTSAFSQPLVPLTLEGWDVRLEPLQLAHVELLEAAAAGLGVAIAPQTLVVDDLHAGRLVAPWGFVETSGCLALWTRRADPRSERLAQWLRRVLV